MARATEVAGFAGIRAGTLGDVPFNLCSRIRQNSGRNSGEFRYEEFSRSRIRQNLGRNSGEFRYKNGFTLFELLVVLAIFIIVATLATPFLLRTFTAQALKGGADQVRAAFDKARVQAIRSGNVYTFLYRTDDANYTIAPLINSYSLVNPNVAASMTDSPAMRQLPKGLTFVGSSVSDDARAQFESEGSTLGAEGMTPILFYPDGTSQDAYLYLQNEQGELIRIYLRGLTGMSSVLRVDDQGGSR